MHLLINITMAGAKRLMIEHKKIMKAAEEQQDDLKFIFELPNPDVLSVMHFKITQLTEKRDTEVKNKWIS